MDKTIVVIVTQPGRVRSSAGGILGVWPGYKETEVGGGGDVAATVISMTPHDVSRPVPSSAMDVAPTILYALGLPLSRELAGTPLPELFHASMHDADRFVDTYGRPFVRPAARSGKPLDQEAIDRLRSLGYIR